MFGSKIKFDKELFEKAKKYAEKAGYSSVEEFITHLIEKEMSKFEEPAEEENVKKRLQGLGYL